MILKTQLSCYQSTAMVWPTKDKSTTRYLHEEIERHAKHVKWQDQLSVTKLFRYVSSSQHDSKTKSNATLSHTLTYHSLHVKEVGGSDTKPSHAVPWTGCWIFMFKQHEFPFSTVARKHNPDSMDVAFTVAYVLLRWFPVLYSWLYKMFLDYN